MHGFGLHGQVKVTKTHDEVTGATSASNGATIDMAGWEGVIFITLLGTPAADNGHKIQQDSASGMGTAADLAGSQVLSDGTETVVISHLHRPRERYVRSVAIRGTSTTIPAGFAIQYGPKGVAFNQDGETDTAYESHVSPAEGTA